MPATSAAGSDDRGSTRPHAAASSSPLACPCPEAQCARLPVWCGNGDRAGSEQRAGRAAYDAQAVARGRTDAGRVLAKGALLADQAKLLVRVLVQRQQKRAAWEQSTHGLQVNLAQAQHMQRALGRGWRKGGIEEVSRADHRRKRAANQPCSSSCRHCGVRKKSMPSSTTPYWLQRACSSGGTAARPGMTTSSCGGFERVWWMSARCWQQRRAARRHK